MGTLGRALTGFAIHCYPRWWREERGEEPYVLVDDLLLDGARSWSVAWSLFRGALDAHLAHSQPARPARPGIAAAIIAWTLFVPAILLAIWLVDQPGQRSFPSQAIGAVFVRPRLHLGGFDGAMVEVFSIAACLGVLFFFLGVLSSLPGALRRLRAASLGSVLRTLLPIVCALGLVLVFVIVQSSHTYAWVPPHEVHAPGVARAVLAFRFGWNLSFTGLFLFATPDQIPAGLTPNVLALTLITLGELAAMVLMALGAGRLFARCARSRLALRLEALCITVAAFGMAVAWCALTAWVVCVSVIPAASGPPPLSGSALPFSDVVAFPLLLAAGSVAISIKSALHSIRSRAV